MTNLVLRNTTPAENRRLPRTFHTYVAFDRDTRAEVAAIKWSYRPKNAGGSAYQANVCDPRRGDGQRVTVYSKDLKKLCEIVRHVYTGEGAAPSHWR